MTDRGADMPVRELVEPLAFGDGSPHLCLRAAARRLPQLEGAPRLTRILVENQLGSALSTPGRTGDDAFTKAKAMLRASAGDGTDEPAEITFRPTRVVLQDHSGLPVLLDLAALRASVAEAGGEPVDVVPRLPVDLVIDHSVEVHATRGPDPACLNHSREHQLNEERFRFLKWAQRTLPGVRVVPPGKGIVHQVHLETLARIVMTDEAGLLAPDTVLGTRFPHPDGELLGSAGLGVGGIEATSALLGDPVSMLAPRVLGVRLVGRLRPGVLAADLALSLTCYLRNIGVVGTMMEFTGPGVASLDVPHRATVANMAPEYGCTAAFFPVDDATLGYLERTGREPAHVALVEAYTQAQGLFDDGVEPRFREVVEFDLGEVDTVVAGPRRPDQRLSLQEVPATVRLLRPLQDPASADGGGPATPLAGAVAIAAITSSRTRPTRRR